MVLIPCVLNSKFSQFKMNTIQPIAQQTNEQDSRAKEIDSGTIPLPMTNAILGLPTKPGLIRDDQSSVAATKWSYDQLVGQKKLLFTTVINSQTDTLKPVFVYHNTWKNIWKTHFNALNTIFMFKSWRLNFEFQFRSNFQQVGMMALSYSNYPVDSLPYFINDTQPQQVPFEFGTSDRYSRLWNWNDGSGSSEFLTSYSSTSIDTKKAIFQLPHTFIMMGEDQDVPVSIEWVSPFKASFDDIDPNFKFNTPYGQSEMATFNDDYDMGTLRLHVPFKMRIASGVTDALTVRVYSWLDRLEYSGYTPNDTL